MGATLPRRRVEPAVRPPAERTSLLAILTPENYSSQLSPTSTSLRLKQERRGHRPVGRQDSSHRASGKRRGLLR